MNNGIAVAAGRADCYEALKQAFFSGRSSTPDHQNIIPHITDTTNNILGQMTGGTMGVEFGDGAHRQRKGRRTRQRWMF